MTDTIETWQEMKDRHNLERAELLTTLADMRVTQTEAARVLGIPLSHLNGFIIRYGIHWPVIRQGNFRRSKGGAVQ